MFLAALQLTGEYLAIAVAGAYWARPSFGSWTTASNLLIQFLE